jgi:hypothetical protein
MAVINVTSGSEVILTLSNVDLAGAEPGAANGLAIPLLQDVTVSTSPGTVRYSTLNSTSSSAFTTVVENEISFNMLLDHDTFFGLAVPGGVNSVTDNGLWTTSNNKTEIYFSIAFEGSSDTGDYFLKGQGFIGGLAPTASIDQAVWITPGTIIVNGDLQKDQV